MRHGQDEKAAAERTQQDVAEPQGNVHTRNGSDADALRKRLTRQLAGSRTTNRPPLSRRPLATDVAARDARETGARA